MTEVTAKLRQSTRLATVLLATCASLVPASDAEARPYTVVSCDSAGLFGHSSAAWVPFANAGSTYATCPSGGGAFAGISDRLTGSTYGGFSFSGHAFTAPAGTSITSIKWAGRMARDNCTWGTYIRALPSEAAVIGLPQNQICTTSGWDTRGWPMTYTVPHGTTRLEQLTLCGARQCAPGAAMHSHNVEVTIEDPIPPSISLSGPLASGQWVSGAKGTLRGHRRTSIPRNPEDSRSTIGSTSDRVLRLRLVSACPLPGRCETRRSASGTRGPS